jgi:hypothetical protein
MLKYKRSIVDQLTMKIKFPSSGRVSFSVRNIDWLFLRPTLEQFVRGRCHAHVFVQFPIHDLFHCFLKQHIGTIAPLVWNHLEQGIPQTRLSFVPNSLNLSISARQTEACRIVLRDKKKKVRVERLHVVECHVVFVMKSKSTKINDKLYSI